MMTVREVSRRTGVTIRALRYYDRIGLLKAAAVTESGYRLYDGASLERLRQILLFRELEFPLQEIREILDDPGYDRREALERQIRLLELKKERLERLAEMARRVAEGEENMDFDAFDTTKMDAYAREAKKAWGHTPEYRECEERNRARGQAETAAAGEKLMAVIASFGPLKELPPDSEPARAKVQELKDCISENFYQCSIQVLAGLGEMYAAGGEMTENIEKAAGSGAAEYIRDAIRAYTKKEK